MPILTEQERLGTLVAGRYRLDGVLGRGGTAIVFDATHTWTNRRVALKLLRPEYAQDLALVRRFMQEARTAAGLAHRNIVEVLDMGADEGDGTVFLVLELLEGETLGGLLARRGRLPADEAIALLAPVMHALSEAHAQGIVHRDVKPDNVFLAREGDGTVTPKLLDFGMAKMMESAWGHATQSGTLVGTPFYMSPEQAKGAPDVGPQSDVWSMGVMLYRAVTGALPFTGTTPTALLLAIVGEPPAPTASLAPEAPQHLASAIDRAIVLDRSVRHADMSAFADALAGRAVAPDTSETATPAPVEVPTWRRSTSAARPSRALAAGAAAVVFMGAALVFALSFSRDRNAASAATVRAAPETTATLATIDANERPRPQVRAEAPVADVPFVDGGLASAPPTARTVGPRRVPPNRAAEVPAETPAAPPAEPPSANRLPGVTAVW